MLNHNCSCYYLRLLTVRGLTRSRSHPNSLTPVSPRQHVATAPTVDFFKLAKTVVKLPRHSYIKAGPLPWKNAAETGRFIYPLIQKSLHRREKAPKALSQPPPLLVYEHSD